MGFLSKIKSKVKRRGQGKAGPAVGTGSGYMDRISGPVSRATKSTSKRMSPIRGYVGGGKTKIKGYRKGGIGKFRGM